jgi:hypothetical protein
MSADSGAGEVDRRAPEERGEHAAIAHGLLREAIDCIKQARDLIVDDESSAVLTRNCDELMTLVNRLAASG